MVDINSDSSNIKQVQKNTITKKTFTFVSFRSCDTYNQSRHLALKLYTENNHNSIQCLKQHHH